MINGNEYCTNNVLDPFIDLPTPNWYDYSRTLHIFLFINQMDLYTIAINVQLIIHMIMFLCFITGNIGLIVWIISCTLKFIDKLIIKMNYKKKNQKYIDKLITKINSNEEK